MDTNVSPTMFHVYLFLITPYDFTRSFPILRILSFSSFAVDVLDILQSRQSKVVKLRQVESTSIHLNFLLFPHSKTSMESWLARASIDSKLVLLDTSKKRSSVSFSMPFKLVKSLCATCNERSLRRLCKPFKELMAFDVKWIASKLTYGSKHFTSLIPLPDKCRMSFNSGTCAYLLCARILAKCVVWSTTTKKYATKKPKY